MIPNGCCLVSTLAWIIAWWLKIRVFEVRESWFKSWLPHLLALFAHLISTLTCLRTLLQKFPFLYWVNNFFLSICCSIYLPKSSIHPTSLSSFCSISLLLLQQNSLKKLYIHCFYFLSTSLFNNLQSGFCLYHPIKIAPLKVKLTFILSNQMCSILSSHLA